MHNMYVLTCLYTFAISGTCHRSGGAIAHASFCMLDMNDNNRPVAGHINICPQVRLH